MPGVFPKMLWEREHKKKWLLYSYNEICIMNNAIGKKQKLLTLPSNNPKKKRIINFENMVEKNLVSGNEMFIRCLLYNNTSYLSWSWKDNNGWKSYVPHLVVLFELAFEKKYKKIDIFQKENFEINFEQFVEVNKNSQSVHFIQREEVAIKYCIKKQDFVTKYAVSCNEILKKMAGEDIDRLHNFLFDLRDTIPGHSHTKVIPAVSEEIIIALCVEDQASTSTQNRTDVKVDPFCPEAKNYHVYSEDQYSFNAALNFANLEDNSNKYFIIQLLKHHNINKYSVWFHWGRVGFKGQNSLFNCGSNLEEAKSVFEKKFYDKTRNNWSERGNFERVPTKYDLVHVQLDAEAFKHLALKTETKLDIRIQNLLQIICNKKNLKVAAKELCYDYNNIPLGKLSARQILEGYDALNEILAIIKCKGKGKVLFEACNKFYTKIPHDFGRKAPPLLYTLDQVKEKLMMLEDLSKICLAMDLLSSSSDDPRCIIHRYYRSLDCNLMPLEHTSNKFKVLNKCLLETHGPTHSAFTMELIDAFMCVKDEQESSFCDFGNKKLLWHGSRISNWIGILKNGLQIAPPEALMSGCMLGKGIYFADSSSKSARFCCATKERNEGLLLLNEVSLGVPLFVFEALDMIRFNRNYQSVFGVGRIQPREFQRTVLSSEATLPCAPMDDSNIGKFASIYNEYVVYNVHQVKMKYLLRIRFKF